jgi:hypothetical protein
VSDETGPEAGEADENPLRRALDLFVFAPVGLALTALEDLPGLVAKGRQEIANARVVGKFVVDQGQREVGQRLGDLLGRGNGPTATPEPATPTSAGAPEDGATAAPAAPVAAPKPAADPADTDLVERALAGYDTLSASQVVRRLESLGPDELRAVQRHEASHRNRRTILNRTSQLLNEDAAPATPATE